MVNLPLRCPYLVLSCGWKREACHFLIILFGIHAEHIKNLLCANCYRLISFQLTRKPAPIFRLPCGSFSLLWNTDKAPSVVRNRSTTNICWEKIHACMRLAQEHPSLAISSHSSAILLGSGLGGGDPNYNDF